MEKQNKKEINFNEPLRAYILVASLHVEKEASSAVKSLLRLVKSDSKTLGNKSSSLSLKNKIDILFDIDDLTKEEYSSALKFMEIRNQFIHNFNCNSFLDLKKENPDLVQFLNKHYPPEFADKNEEDNLFQSFQRLYISVRGILTVRRFEYGKGVSVEIIRYVNSQTLDNFDAIFENALKEWEDKVDDYQSPLSGFAPIKTTIRKHLADFKFYIKNAIADEGVRLIDKFKDDSSYRQIVFRRRDDISKAGKESQQKDGNSTSGEVPKSD